MCTAASLTPCLARPRALFVQVICARLDPRRLGGILVGLCALALAAAGQPIAWSWGKALLLLGQLPGQRAAAAGAVPHRGHGELLLRQEHRDGQRAHLWGTRRLPVSGGYLPPAPAAAVYLCGPLRPVHALARELGAGQAAMGARPMARRCLRPWPERCFSG